MLALYAQCLQYIMLIADQSLPTHIHERNYFHESEEERMKH